MGWPGARFDSHEPPDVKTFTWNATTDQRPARAETSEKVQVWRPSTTTFSWAYVS